MIQTGKRLRLRKPNKNVKGAYSYTFFSYNPGFLLCQLISDLRSSHLEIEHKPVPFMAKGIVTPSSLL